MFFRKRLTNPAADCHTPIAPRTQSPGVGPYAQPMGGHQRLMQASQDAQRRIVTPPGHDGHQLVQRVAGHDGRITDPTSRLPQGSSFAPRLPKR